MKLQTLEADTLRTLTARDNQALELKYLNYPSIRPNGWHPPLPLLQSDEDQDGAMQSDGEFMHEISNRFVPTLEQQLLLAGGNGNPSLETLFGGTIADQLRAKTNLLQPKKRGRPRKSDKSSSGARQGNGVMSQQLNGVTLASHARAPSIAALKGVKERVGGIFSYDTLLQSGAIAGRIQVSFFCFLLKKRSSQKPEHVDQLKEAAQDAIEAERKKASQTPTTNYTGQESIIEASRLVEVAYTQLYNRVQDEPESEGRSVAWKSSMIEQLDKVSLF